MSHWPFILVAYAIALFGTAAMTWWSHTAMKRAEADADALGRDA